MLLSGDQVIHERTIYNVLDLIGDIGGLFDGLNYLAQLIIGIAGFIWNDTAYQFITNQLFSVKQEEEEASRSCPAKFFWSLCCLKKRRILSLGSDKIDKQLEITDFLTR